MESDRERWDRKYAAGEGPAGFQPNPLLVERESLLAPPPGGGRALDLACGRGGNALFLAALGWQIDALDVSGIALAALRAEAARRGLRLNLVQADATRWWIPPAGYDLVVVTHYLFRPLVRQVAAGLRPGGLFIQVAHNQGFRTVRPDFDPAFMVAPGELARLAGEAGLAVIHHADERPGKDHVAELIAARPSGPAAPLSFPPG